MAAILRCSDCLGVFRKNTLLEAVDERGAHQVLYCEGPREVAEP